MSPAARRDIQRVWAKQLYLGPLLAKFFLKLHLLSNQLYTALTNTSHPGLLRFPLHTGDPRGPLKLTSFPYSCELIIKKSTFPLENMVIGTLLW